MKTNNGIILDENDLSTPEISNAGFHNSIYREKNITSYLTDSSLWARISSGKFFDLFVGDYFTVSLGGTSFIMRIAGFDTFYKTYYDANRMNKHHAIIIPDVYLQTAAMNNSGDVTGGYVNTNMFKTVLPSWVTKLETAIGASHVLSVYEYLTSGVDANAKNCLRPSLTGASNACMWKASKANLLSETEVYGYMSYSSSGYENGMVCYGQLPLFRLNPKKIIVKDASGNIYYYWLRNITSSDDFCVVADDGIADYFESFDNDVGVRPRFIIG